MQNFKGISALIVIGGFLFSTAPLPAVQIPLDGVTQVTSDGKTGSKDKIAFVDIEVLFNEHPLKKRLQDEFLAEANKRKKAIADHEKSIQDFEKVIASSTTEVTQAKAELSALQPAAPAPTPAPAQPQGTPQRMLLPGTTEAVSVPPAKSSAPAQPAAPPAAQGTAPAVNPEVIAARQKAIQEKEAAIDTMKKELQKMKDDLVSRVKQDKADLTNLEEKQSGLVMSDLYGLLDKVAKEQTLTIILNKNDVLYGQPYQDITPEVLKRLQGR